MKNMKDSLRNDSFVTKKINRSCIALYKFRISPKFFILGKEGNSNKSLLGELAALHRIVRKNP